jgi:glycopeptide antibiotics resistance protein
LEWGCVWEAWGGVGRVYGDFSLSYESSREPALTGRFTLTPYSLFPSSMPFLGYRIALLVSIIFIVPFGYVVRFSDFLGFAWLHNLLGSVAYEIFWVLLVGFLFPKASAVWTAVGVCLATCGLEFLQLWQSPFLQAARATLLGRLVLGNTFVWSDFISYFLGSFAGWAWMRSLKSYFGKFR